MRGIIKAWVFSFFLLAAGDIYARQLDSAVRAALDSKLAEYFSAIERESVEVQKGECDFLIETCTDSLMRQHVALSVYDHYISSKLMGAESVAVHVYDNWFASGKVRMRSDDEMLAARVFAEFNRQSLIGMKAPELTLYDMNGESVTLFGEGGQGRFAVLYFYDSSCATCKLQSILLRNLLPEKDYPIDFYAVYASDNREAWEDYVSQQLQMGLRRGRVFHLWDPELESDFQRKYGVLQTPRIFLAGPDGTILGRGLDAQALYQMLEGIFGEVELEYGGEESMSLYDGVFGESVSSSRDVMDIADYIESSTLEKGDTVMFRQMTGDLLYYLALQKGEEARNGMSEFLKNKILSRQDIWKSADDSLKVIGMAEMYNDLLSKSTPGRMVPDLKLPGQRLSSGKARQGEFRLRKLRGKENYIMFVTDGCHICAAEKEAAMKITSDDRKVRVLVINVDDILSSDPALAGKLFDSFDLSALPYMFMTDRKGKILRRYITLSE